MVILHFFIGFTFGMLPHNTKCYYLKIIDFLAFAKRSNQLGIGRVIPPLSGVRVWGERGANPNFHLIAVFFISFHDI